MTDRPQTIRPILEARRLAAALAVLLAAALVGPAKAEAAGCGRHIAPGPNAVALMDGLLRGEVTTDIGSIPPLPRPPCSGPACSQGRPPASPTPSTIAPDPIREWGSLTGTTEPPRPTASAALTPDPPVRPVRVPSRPDRPPRDFA